jgi:DNA repair exonuclease SbcCD nuclease subunit
MHPAEAAPLAEVFDYVALGHGHKPYRVTDEGGREYAFNPGAPECVNFGEQRYDKGYYLVNLDGGGADWQFRPLSTRPMLSLTVDLDGASTPQEALERFRAEAAFSLPAGEQRPLVDLKLTGRVAFRPFELGREKILQAMAEIADPLHVEIRNQLSLLSREESEARAGRTLAEIEREVLAELVGAGSAGKGREEELVRLALAIRDRVMRGEGDGEDLLGLLDSGGEP